MSVTLGHASLSRQVAPQLTLFHPFMQMDAVTLRRSLWYEFVPKKDFFCQMRLNGENAAIDTTKSVSSPLSKSPDFVKEKPQ